MTICSETSGGGHHDQGSDVACPTSKCRISSSVPKAAAGYVGWNVGAMPSKVCYRRQPGEHLLLASISVPYTGRCRRPPKCCARSSECGRTSPEIIVGIFRRQPGQRKAERIHRTGAFATILGGTAVRWPLGGVERPASTEATLSVRQTDSVQRSAASG